MTGTTLREMALRCSGMPTSDPKPEPTVSRAALERVLARATELQAASTDVPESLSESQLIEIGREVGIPAEHLRMALAEERTRQPLAENERGPILDALGSTTVSAQRSVRGTPDEILANIDTWMKREEGLDTNRRTAQRMSWSPRNGPLSFIYNAAGRGGNKLDLLRADEVSATVTAIDAARSVVRFDAELTRLRRTQRNLMIGLGIGLNGLVFVTVAVPLLVLAIATAAPGAAASSILGGVVGVIAVIQAAAGYGIWRLVKNQYRKGVMRIQQKLERLLDDIEQGGMVARPSLIGQLRDAMLEATQPLRGIMPPRDV
ncbi:MAG: hypothetical protein ABJB66_05475 [Gemmatimonadaceae bacterium]